MRTTNPVLYSFRRCPYAMRARMAIWQAGVVCELREVVLRDKPAHMLEISPKATVPVLLLADGTVIDESLDVMHWALTINDPDDWLSDAETRSAMLALIAIIDQDFKGHLDRYKYPTRYQGADPSAERLAALAILEGLEDRLTVTEYLFGPAPRLADIAIMPFIRQFANTDRRWFDAQNLPKLQGWLANWLVSDTFNRVMPKFKQWQAGDETILVP